MFMLVGSSGGTGTFEPEQPPARRNARSDSVARGQVLRNEFMDDPTQALEIFPSFIDHTILKPEATQDDVHALCLEAVEYHFAAVCVSPCRVPTAVAALSNFPNQSVDVCTVVGFPHGTVAAELKAAEARWAIAEGATEIDFVQNVGLVKDKDWDAVEREYRTIVDACEGVLTKIILETSQLTNDEIIACTQLACKCGVDIIKTSTGYGTRGASVADVMTISSVLVDYPAVGIKASGGIKTAGDATTLISAGATRLGTSRGVSLYKQLEAKINGTEEEEGAGTPTLRVDAAATPDSELEAALDSLPELPKTPRRDE